MYDYINRVVLTLPLSVYEGTWTHSSLSLLCITMILRVLQGVELSKTQSPPTAEDRKRMKVIPYASAIGSTKYAMLCTRSIVYPTLILAREYNSDLGVDHWTAVKIILTGIRICFSIMEVTKGSS